MKPDTKITAASHPVLFKALEMLSHDVGRQAGHECYHIPLHNPISEIEEALASLSESDLTEFVIGDYDKAEAIQDMHPWLKEASILLDEFIGE